MGEQFDLEGKKVKMKAWINHFALNIGASLACMFYAIVPPQWTGHSKSDLDNLSKEDPIYHFVEGLRGK